MKKVVVCGLLLGCLTGFVALSGCNSPGYGSYGNGSAVAPKQTAPNTVQITNFSFGPALMTVAKGTTVTWQNYDNVAHTATSNSGAWNTGTISPGGSGSIKFDTTGTFPYYCAVHPMMTGTIVVQ